MAERTSVENEEINEQDYSLEIDDLERDDEETDDTQKIREQIEETRQDLSETINALQEKLSLENITEQVTEQVSNQISTVYQKTKETVYENTLKSAGNFINIVGKEMQKSKIYNVAKDNPLPLFLIALGAGMLLFKKSGSGQSSYRLRETNRGQNSGNRQSQLTSKLGDAKDKLSETASSAYQSTTEFADNAYQSVRETANRTYEKVSDLGTQAKEQYDYYLNENPLAVGAVALAAGVGIGMMLPTTSYEENLMGETSRNLLNIAKDKTEETVKSLKGAAGQAVDTFKEEVQTQTQEANKDKAQPQMDAGKDKAQNQTQEAKI